MVNPAYIEHVRGIQRQSEPAICQFLAQLSDAWDLQCPIRTISAQFYDYAWYLQDRGISVVMAINFQGEYPASHTWRLEVGTLAYTKPPFNIYRTLVTFPLTTRGFADAACWINDQGPQRFFEN
jgi:hypothetical protein